MIRTCPVCRGDGCYCKKGENLESQCESCYGEGFVADTAEEWEAEKKRRKKELDTKVEITFQTYRIESKIHPLKPMKWWWCYNLFPHGITTEFQKFCVSIEKVIRGIIRKPVKESVPKFKVSTDCICLNSVDLEKVISKEIEKEN